MNQENYHRLKSRQERMEALLEARFAITINAMSLIERALKHQEDALKRQLEVNVKMDRLQAKIDQLKEEWKIE